MVVGAVIIFFYRGCVDELPCIMVADFHPMMSSGVLGEIQPVKGCLGRAWLILCSSPAKHVLHSLHPPPQRAQLPDTRTRMLGVGRTERQRLQWKSRETANGHPKKRQKTRRGWQRRKGLSSPLRPCLPEHPRRTPSPAGGMLRKGKGEGEGRGKKRSGAAQSEAENDWEREREWRRRKGVGGSLMSHLH